MAIEDAKVDEAKELERLLSEGGPSPGGAAMGKLMANPLVAKVLNYVKANKKIAIIAGVVLLLLLIGGGVAIYFIFFKEAPPIEEVAEPVQAAKEEPEEAVVQKVNAFKLDSFFVPLMKGKEETGEFVILSATLLLSNSKLSLEIVKNISIIRKNIYYILRKKSPEDFKGDKKKLEERLKKEIVTAANTVILSGSGVVTDVYFTQFVVK